MAIDRRTSTPLYLQLKDAVVREIRDSALKPGDRVGSEAELERTHGVSRITVRQAINALVQEGALYRVPGKGTYVAAPKVAPLAAFTSFSENMAAQGLTPSYRLLATELVMPPADVRQELRLSERDRAWRIERLLFADGEPMGLQYGYYPQRFLGDGAGAIAPDSTCYGVAVRLAGTNPRRAALEGGRDGRAGDRQPEGGEASRHSARGAGARRCTPAGLSVLGRAGRIGETRLPRRHLSLSGQSVSGTVAIGYRLSAIGQTASRQVSESIPGRRFRQSQQADSR